ncbi:MAG: peptidase prepilin type [Hyphomicrobiales bacterium]|nr:peptidase prepilin type [Hyphomicrobiales bacterium]
MPIVASLVFPILMAYGGASDLLTMRLPNWLTLAVAGAFVALAATVHMPLEAIGANLACALVVLAGGFALFAFGWIGGGDAKLAAGIAAWIGWTGLLDFLVISAILGGALTLLILQARRWPLPAGLRGEGWIVRLHDTKEGVPYGVALAAAALHVYPATPIYAALVGL